MTKYNDRGYCSSCRKWIKKEELAKKFIPKLKVYAYYCKKHCKQVRIKSRGTPMVKTKVY